jgi:hypothetical protein
MAALRQWRWTWLSTWQTSIRRWRRASRTRRCSAPRRSSSTRMPRTSSAAICRARRVLPAARRAAFGRHAVSRVHADGCADRRDVQTRELPEAGAEAVADRGRRARDRVRGRHAIEPNFALDGRGRARATRSMCARAFTFREVYWLRGTSRPIGRCRAAASTIKPFMAGLVEGRNDAYGRGPCMDALGDNKQIQLETLRKAEFIEKGVRPPMGADPELKNEPASIMPGMITYFRTRDGKEGLPSAVRGRTRNGWSRSPPTSRRSTAHRGSACSSTCSWRSRRWRACSRATSSS